MSKTSEFEDQIRSIFNEAGLTAVDFTPGLSMYGRDPSTVDENAGFLVVSEFYLMWAHIFCFQNGSDDRKILASGTTPEELRAYLQTPQGQKVYPYNPDLKCQVL